MPHSPLRLFLPFLLHKGSILPLVLSMLYLLPGRLDAKESYGRPFNPGDHFYYDVKWGIMKVGEVEMLVERAEEGEVGELKFILLLRTTPWADLLYRVRNRIESFTDGEVTQTLHYRKNQREGSLHREIVVDVDWDKQSAQYSNFGEPLDPIPIEPGCQDPYSILFAYRLHEKKIGQTIRIPVTDGKKTLMTEIEIVRKERVKVEAGKFDCVSVSADVKGLGGVFRKSENAAIDLWFSNDEHEIIVKMTSSVNVGKFRVELRKYVLGKSA